MIEPVAIYFEQCEPGWHVPSARTHNHILLLMTEGETVYTLEQEIPLPLVRGEMLFIPQGTLRSAANAKSEPHHMYAAHFHYEGDGEGLPLLSAPFVCKAKLTNADYIRHRFSQLTQHWLRKSRYAKPLAHGILLEMLALLNEEADDFESPSVRGKSQSIVFQLQQYILEHYRESLSIGDLAAHVGLTPNYVSALFKRTTGSTLTKYIQQIRISAACDLLTGSPMNVSEISDFLGFCEPSYFNKVFKKVTGSLPSAYVKEKPRIWINDKSEPSDPRLRNG